jgi:hypothetical protein
MISEQLIWDKQNGWSGEAGLKDAVCVFVFGDGDYFKSEECYTHIRSFYPSAEIVGCSTSGSISGSSLSDDSVVVTAMVTDKANIKTAFRTIDSADDSAKAGRELAGELMDEKLKHIFILSDGLNINGSMLADAINSVCEGRVSVSGGLAGDGTRFGTTYIMANSPAFSGGAVALGFYGDTLEIHTGCFAGWDEFGALRTVTKSVGNVVYEIDSQPALELYKKYLGDDVAKDLPGSGLRFPINVQTAGGDSSVIRTLLAIDEGENSLTFAGDVPEGHLCRLMKSNIDKLIENSELAAKSAKSKEKKSGICIAISCVGRRLVLGQLTEEELEIVGDTLGDGVRVTGFYSYGEIAPFEGLKECQLHNQTMTITAIYE